MLQSLFGTRTATRIPQVDPFELEELINTEKNLTVVDVRSPQEYQYEGHIAGSRLLPLSALMHRVHELPVDRPIVFVCRSGARSQVACEQLNQLGYANVKNFQGGMIAWKRAGLPTR